MTSVDYAMPGWFTDLLGFDTAPEEGATLQVNGQSMIVERGVLRHSSIASAAQAQTEQTFGFKWKKRDTFDGGIPAQMRRWLIEKYGDICASDWFVNGAARPVVLDAGCGAALSALCLFENALDRIRYVGVDISEAVDVARERFVEKGSTAGFIQSNLLNIPLPDDCADIIFSEGVLHHTDSTRDALAALIPYLKTGGRLLFYVYRRKGPIREFTDDCIRDKLQGMSQDEAWQALLPLTRLGIALGELDIEVNVPESIDLLDIPAGPINLQRLFYWHVFKAFYAPDLKFEEMQHINFDWYAPKNAHRQSPEEVRRWCDELGLVVEHEHIEMAGITIIARKG